MMNWPLEISAYFEPSGWLQAHDPHFTPRTDQARMALAVAQAIENEEAVVIEAGTGIGKTYAYLIPALLSGKKVLISTATKTLQDQLHGRDLPRLLALLGLPVKTALLKGRSSYLCLHRMEMARGQVGQAPMLRALAKVERWAQSTPTGDLSEVSGLDENSPLLPWVTSTRDNCLGSDCPHSKICHVNLARKKALDSDVTVVNHHLFFADLVIRETGQAQLLPAVDVVIFDEAHQLNEAGIQFLGQEIGSGQLLELSRDLLATGLTQARGLVDWSVVSTELELAVRDWRLVWPSQSSVKKHGWSGTIPEATDPVVWQQAMADLQAALKAAQAAVAQCAELGPDFSRLRDRLKDCADRLDLFLQPAGQGVVRWVEVSRGVRLMESPLEIGQWMREKLWLVPQVEMADLDDEPAQVSRKSFVFASATLGSNAELTWFTQPMGLNHARTLSLGSPFAFDQQAALYVPKLLPAPNQPEHADHVAALVATCARALGGRTLVLTTSLSALRRIGERLRDLLEGDQINVLCQGQAAKRELVERFRTGSADSGVSAGCVLVGSASFWEGVDIAGDALMCVIIDKLPFPTPSEPWVKAKTQQIESQAGNPFKEFFIPEAAISLKQGAGRLIRRETDRGVLVVCDPRLNTMGYGRQLIGALPPMKRLAMESELLDYLESIRP